MFEQKKLTNKEKGETTRIPSESSECLACVLLCVAEEAPKKK